MNGSRPETILDHSGLKKGSSRNKKKKNMAEQVVRREWIAKSAFPGEQQLQRVESRGQPGISLLSYVFQERRSLVSPLPELPGNKQNEGVKQPGHAWRNQSSRSEPPVWQACVETGASQMPSYILSSMVDINCSVQPSRLYLGPRKLSLYYI